MPHLVSFTTTKFDASKEEPNPYNPIAGKGLLTWLRGELVKSGWQVTEPDAEDWGWFVVAEKEGASYMIGASGEVEEGAPPPTDWILQIHKKRSLFQKLSGKNTLAADDLLTKDVESIIRDAMFTKVDVDKSA